MLFSLKRLCAAAMSLVLLAAMVPPAFAAEADEFSMASPGPESLSWYRIHWIIFIFGS